MKTILTTVIVLAGLNIQGQILSYTSFRNPGQVESDINTLAVTYPSLASIETIGTSLHGAPIRALRISNSPTNDPSKGDVVLMSLMHVREWITVETLLYITDKMLSQYATDAQLRADLATYI